MTPGFSATVSTPDAHTVQFRLAGDLTFETAQDLDALIARHLVDLPDVRLLVLDCADIAAIDSTGLSILLLAKRRTEEANAHLHLDNRPPRVERMLTLTGTHAYLTEKPTQP